MSSPTPYGEFIPTHFRSPYNHLNSEIITIAIFASSSPASRHNYTIDRALITSSSPYFRRLLEPSSSVAQFKHVDLVDESPEAFDIVLACLKLKGKPLVHDPQHVLLGRLSMTAVYVLAYVLALKLGMEGACNQVMDCILHVYDVRDVFSGRLNGKTISDLPGCKITEFLIEQLAWVLVEKGFHTFCECPWDYGRKKKICKWCSFVKGRSEGFLRVLAKLEVCEVSKLDGSWDTGRQQWKMMGHCYWHVHGDGEGQVVSCPEGRIRAQCVEEGVGLESEQAAESEKGLTTEQEAKNEDTLAEYVEVIKGDDAASALKQQQNEDLLEGLSLDDPDGKPGDADDTAREDDVLSASDFGDFGGRRSDA